MYFLFLISHQLTINEIVKYFDKIFFERKCKLFHTAPICVYIDSDFLFLFLFSFGVVCGFFVYFLFVLLWIMFNYSGALVLPIHSHLIDFPWITETEVMVCVQKINNSTERFKQKRVFQWQWLHSLAYLLHWLFQERQRERERFVENRIKPKNRTKKVPSLRLFISEAENIELFSNMCVYFLVLHFAFQLHDFLVFFARRKLHSWNCFFVRSLCHR